MNESEIVKLALDLSGLNQQKFAKSIGKSQAQVSKYLSGKSGLSVKLFIHLMNIIRQSNDEKGEIYHVLAEVLELNADEDKGIRVALLQTMRAYKGRAVPRL